MQENNAIFSIKDTSIAKGVAICFMLFHHCFLSQDRYDGFDISFAPFNESQVLVLAKFGKICVGIFAFLSAYGMEKSYNCHKDINRGELQHFILRRYTKMITGFWAAYIICMIGCFIFSANTWNPITVYSTGINGFLYAVVDFLGLADLFQTKSLIKTWWYLSFAIVLILIFPLLERGCKKMGWIFLVIICFLPYILFYHENPSEYFHWTAVAVLGIFCANSEVFERIKVKLLRQKKIVYIIFSFFLCFLWIPVIALRNSPLFNKMETIIDCLITFYIILFCYIVLSVLPGLNNIFAFLGKYSMNIYLIHNFIRYKWFYGYTYSYKNVFLIWAMLLLESLAVSIILEWLKKVSHYNQLCQKILTKLDNRYNPVPQ